MIATDTADEQLIADLGDALPVSFTRPTPGAQHDLRGVEIIAKALGTPLMPWQRLVARVATERHPDDPRRFRYSPIVLTVPRQAGKTTLMRAILTHRALTRPGRRAFYTAQTGKDATARWKDLVEQIAASPIRDHVLLRKAAGSQSLTFPTGSTISPFAPTPKSLHGYTPHDVMCDEIFAFDQAQGSDLMAAIGPAQVTLLDRQLWLVSTRGTPESTFLNYWLEQAESMVLDPDAGLAFFNWQMRAGDDPYSPGAWSFHPALGHTITLEDLADLSKQHTFGEWMRAFMNTQTVTLEALIDPAMIVDRGKNPQTPPPSTQEMAIGYEVAADRSRAAIVAAWIDPSTDAPAVRTIHSAEGDTWLAPMLDKLRTEMRPRAIGADDGGPTRDITDQIRSTYEWHDELQILGARDFATACDSLKARILTDRLSLDGSAGMTESFDNVVTRTMGQGYAWDRMKSRGPIPELIAATVALRLLERGPGPAPEPVIRFS